MRSNKTLSLNKIVSTQASLIGKATQKLLLICPQLRIVCLCTGLVRVLHPVTNPARVNGDRTHHLHWVPKSRWAPNLLSPRSQFPMKKKIKKKILHSQDSQRHTLSNTFFISLLNSSSIYLSLATYFTPLYKKRKKSPQFFLPTGSGYTFLQLITR